MLKRFLSLITAVCIALFSPVHIAFAQDFDSLHNVNDIMGSFGYVKKLTGELSTSRWTWCMESYICDNGDGTFSVVDVYDNKVYIDTYDKTTMRFIKFNTVNFLLEKFGGFYCGEKYNYMVFGRDNPAMNKDITTFALVKYDKQTWQIKGITELKNNNTTLPFNSGTVRMAEYGDNLFIRTSHEMYNGHQSSASFVVNTNTMEGRYIKQDSSYVSHSFNQFIKLSGNSLAFVDHGDAAPRSVVLRALDGAAESGDLSGTRAEADLFSIPGEGGANCTGVTVGGFEVSDSNYLATINTIDHSKVSCYTSFEMIGLDKDERDIVVLVADKDNVNSDSVKQIYLTDYVDKGKCGSTPYLVKIDGGLFMVLWQEYEYSGKNMTDIGLRYVYIDENGNMLSDIRTFDEGVLSRDCQPMLMDGKVMWFVNTTYGHRLFYTIDVDMPYISTEYTENTVEVTPVNMPTGSKVYSVFYKSDNLWEFSADTYKGDTVYVNKPAGCTRGGIIITDKGGNLRPLCPKKVLNFD